MHDTARTEPPAWWRIPLGRPSDWVPRRPQLRPGRPRVSWLGPSALVASVAVSWFAFAGAQGKHGSVSWGLFIGAASIVLMAWSFLLSTRARPLEPLFGGLDRMYQVHRWAGAAAVVAMFLHTNTRVSMQGGFRADKALASQGDQLASVAQVLLYVLVGVSLVRWVPYRWWRLSHKFLGVAFVFASFHFYTARKPYPNGSGWGWYFGTIMVVGTLAWVWRTGVASMLLRGRRYRVVAASRHERTLALELEAEGRPLRYRAGQFAAIKIQRPGLREPHLFTIASAPGTNRLEFHIRDLGDWTAKVGAADLVGARVRVEGPFGRFRPTGHGPGPTVWVAGGVGITPFLAAIDGLPPHHETAERPLLIYCVARRADATAIEVLEAAAADGRIRLEVFGSREGRRFTPDRFAEVAGRLDRAHVAVCGPGGLVVDVAAAARRLGAAEVETEDFDIRSGIGPDLSREVDQLVSELRQRVRR